MYLKVNLLWKSKKNARYRCKLFKNIRDLTTDHLSIILLATHVQIKLLFYTCLRLSVRIFTFFVRYKMSSLEKRFSGDQTKITVVLRCLNVPVTQRVAFT